MRSTHAAALAILLCGLPTLVRDSRGDETTQRNATLERNKAAVTGFYTLAFGDVNYEDAPERLRKGVARHPIPLMILARLAVASGWAGKRIGSGLLKDALARTLAAAEIAGLRAFAVHAKDDQARAFYERFDFIASPSDPMHLFVLLKDVRALISP